MLLSKINYPEVLRLYIENPITLIFMSNKRKKLTVQFK